MRVDITSHSNFEAAFEKCLDLYNGIDVLVNNAGVDGEINWESQLQINFIVKICRFLPTVHLWAKHRFSKTRQIGHFWHFNELYDMSKKFK